MEKSPLESFNMVQTTSYSHLAVSLYPNKRRHPLMIQHRTTQTPNGGSTVAFVEMCFTVWESHFVFIILDVGLFRTTLDGPDLRTDDQNLLNGLQVSRDTQTALTTRLSLYGNHTSIVHPDRS